MVLSKSIAKSYRFSSWRMTDKPNTLPLLLCQFREIRVKMRHRLIGPFSPMLDNYTGNPPVSEGKFYCELGVT
jgi:hypothetical protein